MPQEWRLVFLYLAAVLGFWILSISFINRDLKGRPTVIWLVGHIFAPVIALAKILLSIFGLDFRSLETVLTGTIMAGRAPARNITSKVNWVPVLVLCIIVLLLSMGILYVAAGWGFPSIPLFSARHKANYSSVRVHAHKQVWACVLSADSNAPTVWESDRDWSAVGSARIYEAGDEIIAVTDLQSRRYYVRVGDSESIEVMLDGTIHAIEQRGPTHLGVSREGLELADESRSLPDLCN